MMTSCEKIENTPS